MLHSLIVHFSKYRGRRRKIEENQNSGRRRSGDFNGHWDRHYYFSPYGEGVQLRTPDLLLLGWYSFFPPTRFRSFINKDRVG